MNKDVRAFVEAVSDERRPLYDKLEGLILGLYPTAEVGLSYGVPIYRAKSGWVGLGYWKKGVSIYSGHAEIVAGFRETYPTIKTGKGSINFKVGDKVPVAAVKKIIRQVIEKS